jgi:hypothetical protein
MVIMKGKKIDNLYKLLGNTVTVGPVTARTLLEKARRMRFNARLLENFWVEAVNYACFITNRSPSATVDFKVQDEVWTGKPVNYSVLRIFGYPTYVHVQSEEWSKLDSKKKKK